MLPAAISSPAARRVAVEVDGPAHYTNSLPRSLLGSTLAKQRCLQARGWAVLSVPYFTWADLAKQQQQQQQQRATGVSGRVSRSKPASSSSRGGNLMQSAAVDHRGADTGSNGAGDGEADAAVLRVRVQWLAAALDEAVAMADVPKGMPYLRQLVNDAAV
jgi:hypothetical protein